MNNYDEEDDDAVEEEEEEEEEEYDDDDYEDEEGPEMNEEDEVDIIAMNAVMAQSFSEGLITASGKHDLKAKVFSLTKKPGPLEKDINGFLSEKNERGLTYIRSIQDTVQAGDKLIVLYLDSPFSVTVDEVDD